MSGPSYAIRALGCPNATPDNDGLMTAAQVIQLNSVAAAAASDVLIYVNNVTGNDNGAGNAPHPFKSLVRALQAVPSAWKKQCKIFLATTGVPYSVPASTVVFLGSPVGPDATPLAIIGGFTDEDDTAHSAQVGSTPSSIVIPDPTSPDDMRGASIFCETGANAGQARLISNSVPAGPNTNALPNVPFANPVVPGDQFIIQRPSVEIDIAVRLRFIDSGIFGMKGIRLFNGVFQLDTTELRAEGVEIYNFLTVLLNKGAISGGSISSVWAADGVNNPFDSANRNPNGIYQTGLLLIAVNDSSIGSYFVRLSNFMEAEGGSIDLLSTSGQSSEILLTKGATITHNGTGKLEGDLGFYGSGLLLFSSFARGLDDGGVAVKTLEINNCSSDGIAMIDGSYGSFRVSGSGNGGYGINCFRMSQFQVRSTSTLTGALGDTNIGSTPTAYGALPFSEVDISGPTLCRGELF